MNENNWAKTVQDAVNEILSKQCHELEIQQGTNLPYANEILEYHSTEANTTRPVSYETDLLVVEKTDISTWKPRVVIECKIASVTTHDAITYSEKAFAHKRVHPYLRYGIILGNRGRHPLPGRLFRHGLYFDFMASWVGFDPMHDELQTLIDILLDEVTASRNLEEMLYNNRKSNRKRYVVLHKPLRLK